METIRAYIEQMFKNLPKTKEVVEMRINIQDHMEEKFQELVASGVMEAQAVKQVINEFGDMDEILKELNIDSDQATETVNYLRNEEVDQVLAWKKTFSIAIGVGVVLCINAIGFTQLIDFLVEGKFASILMGFVMLVLVGIAVVIFIIFGIQSEKYDKYLKEPLLEAQKRQELEQAENAWKVVFPILIAGGVVLCILAVAMYPVIDYFIGDKLTNFIFFLIVSIGVFLMIYAGINKDTYEGLLRPKPVREQQREEAYNGIIMMTATAIFLILGFTLDAWHPGWIVFVIGGLLCGISDILYKAKGEKR